MSRLAPGDDVARQGCRCCGSFNLRLIRRTPTRRRCALVRYWRRGRLASRQHCSANRQSTDHHAHTTHQHCVHHFSSSLTLCVYPKPRCLNPLAPGSWPGLRIARPRVSMKRLTFLHWCRKDFSHIRIPQAPPANADFWGCSLRGADSLSSGVQGDEGMGRGWRKNTMGAGGRPIVFCRRGGYLRC